MLDVLDQVVISATMGAVLGAVIEILMALIYKKNPEFCNGAIVTIESAFFLIVCYKMSVSVACLSLVFQALVFAVVALLRTNIKKD